ncbi:hypothetical protein P4S65_06905 [Pseudoalteromonas sp. B131b]|uniref:hypothetical protein n=1 Tax=Pseudoalteromonas sp. B131b TaxID=630493 RepID=UPI00301DA8D8
MNKNSHVVLICPDFFDYKALIENQLEKRFAKVHSFSDRPLCSSIEKALIKYNVANYNDYISRRYSQQLLDQLTSLIHDITTIFIIKGTSISPFFIQSIKSLNPNIRVIVYCWDSIANSKGFVKLAELADKAMSFDFADCQQYRLDYVPLFYSDDNTQAPSCEKSSYTYQFSFIGSYHGDRAKLLYNLLKNEKNALTTSFIKIYFQSKIQFIVFYLLDPYIRKCPKEWFTFDIIARDKMSDVFSNSCFIIDIHHKGQSGLTMRTWETLSLNYNLLTTNPYILLHQPITAVDILDRTHCNLWSTNKKSAFVKQLSNGNISTVPLTLSLWLDELFK